MKRTQSPTDPARDLYRRRRLVDVARLLPLLGGLLLILPLLWQPAATPESAVTALGGFVFGVWLVLIAAALALSVALAPLMGAGTATADDAVPAPGTGQDGDDAHAGTSDAGRD